MIADRLSCGESVLMPRISILPGREAGRGARDANEAAFASNPWLRLLLLLQRREIAMVTHGAKRCWEGLGQESGRPRQRRDGVVFVGDVSVLHQRSQHITAELPMGIGESLPD